MAASTFAAAGSLIAYGWSPFFASAFEPFSKKGFVPGRVIIEFNRFYRVWTEEGEITTVSSGTLLHRTTNHAERPAVGDWVAIRKITSGASFSGVWGSVPSSDSAGTSIQAVLPRKSFFSRKVAGRTLREQVVAANIDTVFLMSGLDAEFNVRRIERYLIMAARSGAQPVVLLNKADLVGDSAQAAKALSALLANAPVHAISAKLEQGLDPIRPYLRAGETIGILGSSGVGKTTLINRLLHEDRFETREVRLTDSKGRHTTTNRQLIVLPEGALLIDTPGMREVQLWDAEEAVGESFADIEAIEAECRFSNCRHQDEPGCAVQAAIEAGRLDIARLEGYFKIQEELDRLAAQQTPRGR